MRQAPDLADKERVLFFIPSLDAGGAERVCLNYLQNLHEFEPILLVQSKRGRLLSEVKPDLQVIELLSAEEPDGGRTEMTTMGLKRLMLGSLKNRFSSKSLVYRTSLGWQAYQIAQITKRYNCSALSSFITMPNILAICAKTFFNRRLKVVINVHDVTSQILDHTKLNRAECVLLKQLISFFYPKADLVVAITEGVKQDLARNFGVPPEKILVINNPIDVDTIKARSLEGTEPQSGHGERLVVSMGRLAKLKGFDSLIRAFAEVSKEIDCHLLIIGEGEERESLQKLIEERQLGKRVRLVGYQENPWWLMAQADVFVLASRIEGLPNAVAEALALGLPVVATDCSSGVREYLANGQYGVLVKPDDERALAAELKRVLVDEKLRQSLSAKALERAKAFDLPAIVAKYESALAFALGQQADVRLS